MPGRPLPRGSGRKSLCRYHFSVISGNIYSRMLINGILKIKSLCQRKNLTPSIFLLLINSAFCKSEWKTTCMYSYCVVLNALGVNLKMYYLSKVSTKMNSNNQKIKHFKAIIVCGVCCMSRRVMWGAQRSQVWGITGPSVATEFPSMRAFTPK